jgi:hypothetical protein
MARPRSYEECLADRQTIRKRGGTPRALPAALEPARQAFVADVASAVVSEDPAAALEQAITKAAAQIITQAIQALEAEEPGGRTTPAVTTRQEDHAMDATEYITKGGTTWPLIEARAAERVAKTVGTMTREERAKAVSDLLATKEGAALYSRYCEEQEQVAKRHARSRLAPPDGVR